MGIFDGFKRKKPVQKRNYAAASKGRLFADFNGSNRSADSEIRWALNELRNRSRDLERNNEYYRAYDRSRSIFPQRVKLRSERLERLKNDPELRAKANEAQARWKDRNVIKRRCHVVTGNALRDGRLVPRPCERCGHAINVQAHHEDYTKPLEVVWLCPPCHGARHREINEDRWQKVA